MILFLIIKITNLIRPTKRKIEMRILEIERI